MSDSRHEGGRRRFIVGTAASILAQGAAGICELALAGAGLPAHAAIPALPSEVGAWSPVLAGPIVAIHAALLPLGNVIVWQDAGGDIRNQFGKTLAYRILIPTGQLPSASSWLPLPNETVDLFCAGQAILPDGKILVVGGQTGGYNFGIDTATIFDPWTSSWTPGSRMANRRWYPSLITLPNGEVLALSGTQAGAGDSNEIPEVWKTSTGGWRELNGAKSKMYTYPWVSIDPLSGRVFVAGPQGTKYISTVGDGKISASPPRKFALRSAGTFAVYGPGKVLAVGGGDDNTYHTAERIDLLATPPSWIQTSSMHFGRRYATATTLPDGTVLVVGGGETQIGPAGVLPAEIWNPATGTWAVMASMAVPRLYHSIAILLPDGRVMVGGGGRKGGAIDHPSLQFFSPPYLFKGTRPIVSSAPTLIRYGQSFVVQTPDAASISKISLMRFSALTHMVNTNQAFYPVSFTRGTGILNAVAPPNGNYAPPGYYMLFALNAAGVPSIAKIIQIL